ncbi:MAG: EamA/RhaT family transporter, partial [Croceimicrobium sp.]
VSQNYGMATVSVAVKMAVIVPVSFGILYFHESAGPLKLMGIVLALVAVYMTTYQPQKMKRSSTALWFPIILFIGSGFLDAFLKYNEAELVPKLDQAWFASSIFGCAGLFGLVLVLYQMIFKGKKFPIRSVIGGFALGIPNYGSIYFLLRALSLDGLESSSIFALNNVGVVFLSAVIGYFFFKEQLSKINLTGILLAMVSIVLIALVL